MAKCRIQNLTPTCAYNGSGVTAVMLLDLEDFGGFVYENGEGYQSCYVQNILRTGDFITVEFNDFPAQYSGPLASGIYSHSVEAFVSELSAEIISNLHLASKRPQLVVFKTWEGRYFTFGQETGAKVNYTAQTTDGTGAAITFTQNSHYPLFEVSPLALQETYTHLYTWVPLFDETAFCTIDGDTDSFNGFLQATIVLKYSSLTGAPLDINNIPIETSGRKQAAYIMYGTDIPADYDVQGTYFQSEGVEGVPSLSFDPQYCSEGEVVQWILEDGTWNNTYYWLDDGIWNF